MSCRRILPTSIWKSLDASTAGADGILAAAGQVPFGSDRRLVIVKGMEQWRERAKNGEAERLAEGIARLSETVCLVLVAAAEDEEERRKTAVSANWTMPSKKSGALVACRGLKGDSLLAWVGERVKREGKRIEANAAEQLVATAGGEMLVLEQEISKLVCYVGERETITDAGCGDGGSVQPGRRDVYDGGRDYAAADRPRPAAAGGTAPLRSQAAGRCG